MTVTKFTRLFYIFQFFSEFILLWAIDKLFFIDRGLELYHIGILLVCWSGFAILLEIPTGTLADKWSRKNMLVLSGFFDLICFVIWFFSSSFWLFLLGFFFLTIAGTFISGTLQAYLYDFLVLKGREEEFEKVWGRGSALRLIGTAAGMSLGGFLSLHSYELVVGMSVISPVIVIAVALLLPRINPVTTGEQKNYFQFMKSGIKQTFSHPVLLRAFFFIAFVLIVPGILEEYDQVLLSSWLNMTTSFIGSWLAICFGIRSIGAFFAHKHRHRSWQTVDTLAVITGVILVAVPFSNSALLLIVLIIINAMYGFTSVLIQGIIQREIDTDERATITSVISSGEDVSTIPLGLAFAFIADAFEIQTGYGFSGIVILVYMMTQYAIRKVRAYR